MAERIQQLRRSILATCRRAADHRSGDRFAFRAVLVTDGDGKVNRLNRAAESLSGARTEVIGKPIAEIAHDQRIAMAVSEALRAERAVAAESVAAAITISINGSEQSFRLRTTPMRDEEGHLLGAVALLENITHLREIDRLKSEFVNTAAHYSNAAVKFTDGIALPITDAAGEITDKQKDILYACREDIERLESLMRDLTDLSRIESARPRRALRRSK